MNAKVIRFGFLSLLCLPLSVQADVMYSINGTYTPYTVAISFDTSLTGAALDNLSSDNITSTVSDFHETNGIPGNGTASLNVTISTDSLGNITTFSITDTSDQVVTNTEDSGETAGTPPTFSAPNIPGDTYLDSFTVDNIFTASYFIDSNGNLVTCTYDENNNELIDNDGPGCPSHAVETGGSPPQPVSASGTGTSTSDPLDPGQVPSAVPEPAAAALLGSEVAGLWALAIARKRIRDYRKPRRS